MITDWFLQFIINLLGFVNGLMPDMQWSPDEPVGGMNFPLVDGGGYSWTAGTYIRRFIVWLAGFNDILPISEIAGILTLTVTTFGILFTVRSIRWFVGTIRGSGTT